MEDKLFFDYIGNCTEIDYAGEYFGFDPTQFAQAEEEAIKENRLIDKEIFWSIVGYIPKDIKDILLNSNEVEFGYDDYLGIIWAYEPYTDIHYFFV